MVTVAQILYIGLEKKSNAYNDQQVLGKLLEAVTKLDKISIGSQLKFPLRINTTTE
jgi:hypothetical protein